jgi:hypothetical protein
MRSWKLGGEPQEDLKAEFEAESFKTIDLSARRVERLEKFAAEYVKVHPMPESPVERAKRISRKP